MSSGWPWYWWQLFLHGQILSLALLGFQLNSYTQLGQTSHVVPTTFTRDFQTLQYVEACRHTNHSEHPVKVHLSSIGGISCLQGEGNKEASHPEVGIYIRIHQVTLTWVLHAAPSMSDGGSILAGSADRWQVHDTSANSGQNSMGQQPGPGQVAKSLSMKNRAHKWHLQTL